MVKRNSRRQTLPPHLTFLSPADLEAMLGVGASTVRRWVATGRLPKPIRIGGNEHGGGTLRWRLSDIETFAANLTPDAD